MRKFKEKFPYWWYNSADGNKPDDRRTLKKFCIAILFIILVWVFWPKKPTEDVYYNIPIGTSVLKIQNDLFKMGFEPVYGLFLFRLAMTHQLKNVRAGEYYFGVGTSPLDIICKLTKGNSITYKLHIPEGLTTYQIVQRINKSSYLTGMIHDIPPEGSLFPTTLLYQKGHDRSDIVRRLQKMMMQKLEELCDGFKHEHLKNAFEVLIMASIVERESNMSKERPMIAGVYLNRLERGMKLQADPCVIYAATKGRTSGGYVLRKSDLHMESPYNVYKYHGLPPTPICCPGEAAIQAVIDPFNSDAIFFVATGQGGHRFAKTYADHCKNIQLWKKTMRAV